MADYDSRYVKARSAVSQYNSTSYHSDYTCYYNPQNNNQTVTDRITSHYLTLTMLVSLIIAVVGVIVTSWMIRRVYCTYVITGRTVRHGPSEYVSNPGTSGVVNGVNSKSNEKVTSNKNNMKRPTGGAVATNMYREYPKSRAGPLVMDMDNSGDRTDIVDTFHNYSTSNATPIWVVPASGANTDQ
jgi:hypothetical protein